MARKQPAPSVERPQHPKLREILVNIPRRPDGSVVLYDQQFKLNPVPKFSLLDAELMMFRHWLLHGKCPLPPEEHWWKIVDILFPKGATRTFYRHPWAEKMTYEACREKDLGISGCASCVAGSTRIPNPLTGEQPTIQELCELGIAPVVMTMDGPAKAGVPFLKGKADLYRVRLRNGTSFESTADHRVLTAHGFVPVASLRCGQSIHGYWPVLARSTSGNAPTVRASGAHCSPRTTANFQVHCSACSCPDGELPLTGPRTFQASLPSQGDAQACSGCASVDEDGWGNKSGGIRPCPLTPHPSSVGFSPLEVSLARPCLFHSSPACASHGGDWFSPPSQCWPERHLPRTSSESDRDCGYRQSFSTCADYVVSDTAVQSITRTGCDWFYDLNVPIQHHYFAEGAIHHNSGKSDWLAVWGMVNWLALPLKTTVLYLSTTMREAESRVWGKVISWWEALPLPIGRFSESKGQILTNVDGAQPGAGLRLIPGEKKKERDAVKSMIGVKNERVIVAADELPELSPAILDACYGNLVSNRLFQLIGLGNFNSYFDPFGLMTEPADGWDSLGPEDEEWKTKRGKCIRFDGEKSPNVLAGRTVYPHLYDIPTLREHEKLGKNSRQYWRMCRSFPAKDAESDKIYGESDLLAAGARKGRPEWIRHPVVLASLDPAFTNGGDRTMMIVGEFGVEAGTNMTLLWIRESKQIFEDVRIKDVPRSFQVARQVRDYCKSEGITPENFALDTTGAGIPMGEIMAQEWSLDVNRINFGGAASELPESETGVRPGNEAYVNRMSEIWYQGLAYFRAKQIRGVTISLAKELTARRYDTTKQGSGLRVRVEPKEDMKARVGYSPDEADAFLMMIELLRQRFGWMPFGWSKAITEKRDESEFTRRVADDAYDESAVLVEAL